MTAILGISAFYHDSAAALVIDGRIVAAAQEERFTRKKHDFNFPQHAIEYCLHEARLETGDLDVVGFYDKPFLKFDRLLETYLAYAPRGFRSFLMAMPLWLRTKLHLPREMRRGLHGQYRKRFVFTDHHQSHAASAFFPSPFEEAAILTVDGVGEWATASLGTGRGNRIELTHQLDFPHSLGLLYSAFTYFCGFRVNSGEYKLMGLAPYGEPTYAELIRDRLLDIKSDGSFRMDMRYFNYCQGLTMTNRRFEQLFGGPPRRAESPITQREMDLAASIQLVTEEIMLRMAAARASRDGYDQALPGRRRGAQLRGQRSHLAGRTVRAVVDPAGGRGRGRSVGSGTVHLASADGPTAANRRRSTASKVRGWGRPFRTTRSWRSCSEQGAVHQRLEMTQQLCDRVADLLADGNVVGWMQGRMEFGPRALGSRSILGDARNPQMQAVMNLKIKFRESFRPFAPSVLQEQRARVFCDAARPVQSLHAAGRTGEGRAVCDTPQLNLAGPS